jgi:hypothetical protein
MLCTGGSKKDLYRFPQKKKKAAAIEPTSAYMSLRGGYPTVSIN